jgi:hypothetical protein
MIHIIISISDKPMQIVLHRFETKAGHSKAVSTAGHTLHTFLYPLLKKVAHSVNARFRSIE